MLHHVHGVIRFDAVLERRREYVHDNIVTQNRRRVKDGNMSKVSLENATRLAHAFRAA